MLNYCIINKSMLICNCVEYLHIMYISRRITSHLQNMLEQFPVLSLTGPRQSGKTTLLKNAFPDYKYYNLERIDYRNMITSDPIEFLKNAGSQVIFDEAQHAPDIFSYIQVFSDERITLDSEEKTVTEEFDESSLHTRQLLKTKLVDLDLSVRALNCLKAADVETLGDLVQFNKNDLLKFRNFGKKSLTELEELVKTKGLEFGMNISKYKLDKE